MVVHVDEKEQIVGVNGQFEPALNAPTQPLISQSQAEALALKNLREIQLAGEVSDPARIEAQPLTERTKLGVYVDEFGKANLVWAVNVLATQPLGGWMRGARAW
jgi:Zn-dependent metalloprotease